MDNEIEVTTRRGRHRKQTPRDHKVKDTLEVAGTALIVAQRATTLAAQVEALAQDGGPSHWLWATALSLRIVGALVAYLSRRSH